MSPSSKPKIKALIALTLLLTSLPACSWLEQPTSNPEWNDALPSWCGGAMILTAILIGILDIRRERETKHKRKSHYDDD